MSNSESISKFIPESFMFEPLFKYMSESESESEFHSESEYVFKLAPAPQRMPVPVLRCMPVAAPLHAHAALHCTPHAAPKTKPKATPMTEPEVTPVTEPEPTPTMDPELVSNLTSIPRSVFESLNLFPSLLRSLFLHWHTSPSIDAHCRADARRRVYANTCCRADDDGCRWLSTRPVTRSTFVWTLHEWITLGTYLDSLFDPRAFLCVVLMDFPFGLYFLLFQ